VVNAVAALLLQPPAGGWRAVRWPFFAGILLAALGGCLVTLYKPNPPPPPRSAHPAAAARVPGAERILR
jgi:hypothetical protein